MTTGSIDFAWSIVIVCNSTLPHGGRPGPRAPDSAVSSHHQIMFCPHPYTIARSRLQVKMQSMITSQIIAQSKISNVYVFYSSVKVS